MTAYALRFLVIAGAVAVVAAVVLTAFATELAPAIDQLRSVP